MSSMAHPGRYIGTVIGGSTQGIEVRIDENVSVEQIKVGSSVTAQGSNHNFYGLITDLFLAAANPQLGSNLPDTSNSIISDVVSGTSVYGIAKFLPMLTLPEALGTAESIHPAKTIPAHFSKVHEASEETFGLVFGQEDKNHFWIGNPLDLEAKICLDLNEFLKKSNGIFGKTGTGKTFLTRLILAGTLQSDKASCLVFDMHSEYGWQGYRESGTNVKGLKQLFPNRVAVFSLDQESSTRRNLTPDHVVRIGYDEIEPGDVQLLRETMNLSEVAASATYSLERKWGHKWFDKFTGLESADSVYELEVSDQPQALRALYNRLKTIRDRFPFLVSPNQSSNSVEKILEFLDKGKHVVLEFGRYGSDLSAYMLVVNLLTRRIHDRYMVKKEQAVGDKSQEPRPLVIVIEEAHKFLNPTLASQTIFGTIAREDRKFNVTLLVIDQRPSAIDSEVMSQIGTKITCLMDNERDVEAVLSGASGHKELRGVLSKLESKQQALIFGDAVPVPVVIQVREYGSPESYKQLGIRIPKESPQNDKLEDPLEDPEDELFG